MKDGKLTEDELNEQYGIKIEKPDPKLSVKGKRPDDWYVTRIAAKFLTRYIGAPTAPNLMEEGLVEAGADALIAAGYRPVPSVEEIEEKDFFTMDAEEIRDWLLEGDKEKKKPHECPYYNE